jgi:CheY-like chemotaxis protein/anti-sigma regulatory factor (Ser/Thr protein kinase)
LLNDILDFSKIEAGRLDLERRHFRLGDTVADALRVLAVRAHAKGLDLAYRIGPNVPDALVGDSGRLRQVLINLVGNAIKFTERGEVVVEVQAQANDSDVELQFSVRDTGIGIPADKLQRVFDAFVQADASTTRNYGGTGLGLTISARLVELMDGRIWVESTVGNGSTFHFKVRLGQSQVSRPIPVSVRNQRALVVDGHATNRALLQELLYGWRIRPVVVGTSRAALEELSAARSSEPFALLLVDARMPDMDAFMLLEQIRSQHLFMGAVVMMLPPGDQRDQVALCRQLGVARHLVKPIKPSDLFETVVAALAGAEPDVRRPAAIPLAAPVNMPLHILLAEDNAINQRLAVRFLEKQGHHVVLTCNGREAVQALHEQTFDLILMDVQMPEVSGTEASAMIRQREKLTGGHIPIIALTAHAMKGHREQCLSAGMDDFVSKPISAEELYAAIARWTPTRDSLPHESVLRVLDDQDADRHDLGRCTARTGA